MERLGRVLGRLGAEKGGRGPGVAAPLGRWEPTIIKEEETLYCRKTTLQTSTDPLPKNLDTRLGAFGPGADMQRAAKLRFRHRACAEEVEPINEKSIAKSTKIN